MIIDGQTKCLGVIGKPIAHSLSPRIHNYLIAQMNLPYVYLAFPVDKKRGLIFLEAAREIPIYGLNVTMPLKEIIFSHLSVTDSFALSTQGVNTLVLNQETGRYDGYNTDGEGFISSLPSTHQIHKNSHLLILGAGGAARSIGLLVRERGGQVTFMVRDMDKARRQMKHSMPVAHLNSKTIEFSFLPWNEALPDEPVDILVNATPIGMTDETDHIDFSFLTNLGKETLIYDLIYHPWETTLLQRARKMGFPIQNGWPMLVRQAILSFQLFTGEKVPTKLISQLLSQDFESIL